QAGMIYRPVRERSPEHLMSLTASSIAATGYEDISLLSLSTGDYGCIAPLIERLMVCFASDNVAVSLPSLRAGTLTPELMRLIKMVRKTGFTIAPEAGSQRLRDVINKNISETEIIDTVQDAFRLGWQVIKLYFMIGLPTETDDDLGALVDLVKKLVKIKGPNKQRGKINVSVATFIPKAHTPFQWARQVSLAESRSKINWLHDQLKIPGIQFKWQDPRVSRLEGLWARGDRRLSRLLIAAHKKGCKFDGWSDAFRYDLWLAALEEENLHPVSSPIVGTFYRAPNPDADPYVKVGDFVEQGQTLCIVEAMKLMNEIEADISGTVVKVLPENAQAVEYGESLFMVRPA
ncbi:MAG: acetyl-CoA carboxylase biotin carboxyl carrier protein, partial [Thermoanaerobaculales bacterium]|nr:acetyl-CoA carboxylase biotin carboxyl carrier protein [Thermoanaerobaculales bacterium]